LSRDPSPYLDRIALRPHIQTTSNTPNSASIHSVHHRSVFFYFEGQEQKGVERSGLHVVFIAFNCGSDLGVLLEAGLWRHKRLASVLSVDSAPPRDMYLRWLDLRVTIRLRLDDVRAVRIAKEQTFEFDVVSAQLSIRDLSDAPPRDLH
jgi:hypothetical protein